MTGLAIALVLVAAVLHATWNLIAKKAETSGGGPAFVWLFTVLAALFYSPVAFHILLTAPPDTKIGWAQVGIVTVSACLHMAYYLSLQKGYKVGDFSLVYPVARGVAPLLATTGAILFFGERPSLLALVGAVLVSLSIFLLASDGGRTSSARSSRQGVAYGILVAVFIATYTLWDKQVVSIWLVPPLLLDWGANVIRSAMLVPYAITRWEKVKEEWRVNGRRAVGVALLSPLGYILVLQAFTFTPASYVAPAREVSILVGTLMGARFLNEAATWKRIAGACGMVVALAALALG